MLRTPGVEAGAVLCRFDSGLPEAAETDPRRADPAPPRRLPGDRLLRPGLRDLAGPRPGRWLPDDRQGGDVRDRRRRVPRGPPPGRRRRGHRLPARPRGLLHRLRRGPRPGLERAGQHLAAAQRRRRPPSPGTTTSSAGGWSTSTTSSTRPSPSSSAWTPSSGSGPAPSARAAGRPTSTSSTTARPRRAARCSAARWHRAAACSASWCSPTTSTTLLARAGDAGPGRHRRPGPVRRRPGQRADAALRGAAPGRRARLTLSPPSGGRGTCRWERPWSRCRRS